MSDEQRFGESAELRGDYTKLGQWLQQVLSASPDEAEEHAEDEHDNQLELILRDDYHLSFYQQLPDFIMALLNKDPQASSHYAPLLFHLVSCHQCHNAYLELYDAMREAVHPQGPRPIFGQGQRALSAIPHRMLSHLCQSLISQSEALLYQGRHDHVDNDAAARSLLQQALRVSSHIVQAAVRREALHDLVRVATLFDGPAAPDNDATNRHAYTPVMAGAGALRHVGTRPARRADANLRPGSTENAVIQLQSRSLEGTITQKGNVLELHLHALAAPLHGQYVTISVLLGSLLEPIRWRGGDPRAIRSAVPVDEHGTLVTPIGETELQLSNPEERNLVEALFLLLEVQVAR